MVDPVIVSLLISIIFLVASIRLNPVDEPSGQSGSQVAPNSVVGVLVNPV